MFLSTNSIYNNNIGDVGRAALTEAIELTGADVLFWTQTPHNQYTA